MEFIELECFAFLQCRIIFLDIIAPAESTSGLDTLCNSVQR